MRMRGLDEKRERNSRGEAGLCGGFMKRKQKEKRGEQETRAERTRLNRKEMAGREDKEKANGLGIDCE